MKNLSRRNFVKNVSLATAVTATFSNVEAKSTASELFVHHVFFYLKNPSSEIDKAKLLEGLEKLAKVKTIKFVHIGSPAATTRDVIERGYSISWLCFFDSLVDEELYQIDPIHLKFVKDYAHLWQKVVIYDSLGAKR